MTRVVKVSIGIKRSVEFGIYSVMENEASRFTFLLVEIKRNSNGGLNIEAEERTKLHLRELSL